MRAADTSTTCGTLSATVGASVTYTAPTSGKSCTDKVTASVSANSNVKQTFTVTTNIPPSITTTTLPAVTVNTTYMSTLAATGGTGTLSWSLASGSALPAGLSLSTAGVISGTPTAAGTSTFTAQVTDANGSVATQQLSLAVAATSTITSFKASPANIVPVTTAATSVTLSWTVDDATSVSLDNGIGTVTGNSFSVSPTATTTYTLTAVNTLGSSVTATVTVGRLEKLAVLAGNPNGAGSTDGSATDASFAAPQGIARDFIGNLYIADSANDVIRKIAPDGTVTTLAGKDSTPGTVDGKGSAARFNTPYSLAWDAYANVLLVGQTGSSSIRTVTADGTVSTMALDFTCATVRIPASFGGGSETLNYLPGPMGLAVDASGNIYVATGFGDLILKVTAAGKVSVLGGELYSADTATAEGTLETATFAAPYAIALDGNNVLYVANFSTEAITKIDIANDSVITIAGGGGWGYSDGIGTSAWFDSFQGLTVGSDGNIYVAGGWDKTIRKVVPAGENLGVVTTIAGLGWGTGSTDGVESDARFYFPAGITVDDSGNLYVADSLNNNIRKITPAADSYTVSTIAGKSGNYGSADGTGSAATFLSPDSIVKDASSGNIYVTGSSTLPSTIRQITPTGKVSTLNITLPDSTSDTTHYFNPTGLAMDSAGNIYATESNVVRKITPDGTAAIFAGQYGTSGKADGQGTAATFSDLSGITIDTTGTLYVAGGSEIRSISASGNVTTIVGNNASSTPFSSELSGIVYDPVSDALYVIDYTYLHKVTTAGTVTTLTLTDSAGNAVKLNQGKISVDSLGNIYVTNGDTIQKITPAGVVSTIIGVENVDTFTSGALPGKLNAPTALTVDADGNLYITVPDAVLTLVP